MAGPSDRNNPPPAGVRSRSSQTSSIHLRVFDFAVRSRASALDGSSSQSRFLSSTSPPLIKSCRNWRKSLRKEWKSGGKSGLSSFVGHAVHAGFSRFLASTPGGGMHSMPHANPSISSVAIPRPGAGRARDFSIAATREPSAQFSFAMLSALTIFNTPNALCIGLSVSKSSSVFAMTWNRGRPWSSARTWPTSIGLPPQQR